MARERATSTSTRLNVVLLATWMVGCSADLATPAATSPITAPDVAVMGDVAAPDEGAPAEEDVPDTTAPDLNEPDVDPALCPADQCEIDEQCHGNEDVNPDNPCSLCLVVVTRTAWTANDKATCDDGDPCSTVDVCKGGECAGTAPLVCDDGNPCTDDSCDPATGECQELPNAAACDDGNPCWYDSVCTGGACPQGSEPRDCTDSNACSLDECDSKTGCFSNPILDGEPCDDGDLCTVGETCTAGECSGFFAVCDDGDVCTADVCVVGQGCVNDDLAALCDDNNLCTDESCQVAEGCVYTFNTVGCEDGSVCTEGDTCSGGACLGNLVDPNDKNPCTDDSCNGTNGFVHTPNAAPCDDGNPCTLNDICGEAACGAGGEHYDCDDDDPCTTDSCDPELLCQYELNEESCDDGSVCTQTDTCFDGQCVGSDPVDCEDGNECTVHSCNEETGCHTTIKGVAACRPEVQIFYPERAATILGDTNFQFVTVTGVVESGAAPITSLTVNGEEAVLQGDAFVAEITPNVGGNTLVVVAKDSLGGERKRVQSFLWSTSYMKPELEKPKSGMADPGVGIWLSSLVFAQLTSSLAPLMSSLDLATAIDNPAASAGGYDVYITNVTTGSPTFELAPEVGGLGLFVLIPNVKMNLDAKGDCEECILGICVDLCPDVDGTFKIDSVEAVAHITLSVVNHQLKAEVSSVTVNIHGPKVDLDGVVGFLVEPIVNAVVKDFKSDLEKTLAEEVGDVIGEQVESALSALAFESEFEMPSLDPEGDPVTVSLKTDFSSVAFTETGGVIRLRSGAYAPKVTPHDNLGAPQRVGCNIAPQTLPLEEVNPFELMLSDDMINGLLYAAWRGGLLELSVPAETLSDADLTAYGITDLSVNISGMLAPTLSDCGDGKLRVHIGDMRVLADLSLLGTELTVEMFISFVAGFKVSLLDGALGLGLSGIESIESEVTVLQDDLVGSEALVAELINDNMIPGLLGALDGGALGGVPLPALDLGDGASLTIAPTVVKRAEGNTLVGGELK